MLRLVLCAVALAPWSAIAGTEPSPPEIVAHSQLEFAVRKGDLVTVEVKAKGERIVHKWVRSDTTICRERTCEFDTGDWGLGTHHVTMIVYNDLGSLFLNYRIRVLTVPPGYAPARVTAPLVEGGQAVERVRNDDFVVQAKQGRSYSHNDRKVQVVGPTPRALDFSEKLRTQARGTLRFGRQNEEEHVLGESSSVYLAKSAWGRRAIVLREGLLRSRQLAPKDPAWSIVVGPWLQIDTDARGDVLVERQVEESGPSGESAETLDEIVTVTVLRGAARIFQQADDQGFEGKAVTVGQGLELKLRKSQRGSEPAIYQADARRLATKFEATTPDYLPGQDPARLGMGWTIAGGKRPETTRAALNLAREANERRDYMLALEVLAPRVGDLQDDVDGALALGEATFGLGLLGPSMAALERAAALSPEAAQPHFLMGVISLAGGEWRNAAEHLETAEDLGHPRRQELAYYLGVARLNEGSRLAARQAFAYALWEQGSSEIEDSARSFLRRVEEESWVDLRFGAGIFYDTNVLRSDDIQPAAVGTGEIGVNRSPGYFGRMGFDLFALRSAAGRAAMTFDIERRDYVEASLGQLATIDQRLGFALGVGIGQDEAGEAYFEVGLSPFARMIFLGEERAIDQLGSLISLGTPAFSNLVLRVESALAVDPLPGRDDLLDPLLGEAVAPGDRSHRELGYALGVVPVSGRTWRMSLDIRSATTVMREEAQGADDHKDLGIDLAVDYRPGFREEFGVGLARVTRVFGQSEDDRRDVDIRVGGHWTWRYTPALFHTLDLGFDTRNSNRALIGYKRQLVEFSLGIDL